MNIKDIAKLSGVSVSTVSKIVNKKDQSISQETRERVLKIVREYNYIPYSSTKKSPNSGIIGVLINSAISADSCLNGIMKQVQHAGFSTMILNSYGNPEQELKNISNLVSKNIDGLIWEPLNKESLKNRHYFDEQGIPFVLTGAVSNSDSYDLPYKHSGYFLAVQLIEKKHQNIACLIDDTFAAEAFISGYKQALFDHNLPYQEELIFTKIDRQLADFIVSRRATGIISLRLSLAIELELLTERSGLYAPKDYSLVSLSNAHDRAILANSSKLSTVTLDTERFGAYLGEILIARIDDTDASEYHSSLKLDNPETVSFPYEKENSKILVVGSINMDTYLYSAQLPHSGATNFLTTTTKLPGGKGFNQSVGIARLHQPVRLLGCVGSDTYSNSIFQELERNDVDTIGIQRSPLVDTGQAYVFVESGGDSMISVLPGANHQLAPAMIEKNLELFSDAKYCLIQTELPLATVEATCKIAKNKGLIIFLKPAASKKIPDSILSLIDYLLPNEDELTTLCEDFEDLESKAEYLLDKGVKNVIVTLGNRGCFLKNATTSTYFPASDFSAVDTTGASDAFISALSVYLLRGYQLPKAIQIATHAAGFSVSRDGVLNSLVDKTTLESYLSKKEPELLTAFQSE